MNPRVYWYAGCPASGKTIEATSQAVELVHRTGRPLLVIDTEQVENFAALDRAWSVDEALKAVWREGRSVAFTPIIPDPKRPTLEVDQLARAARCPGDVVLLVDEASHWLSSSLGRGGELLNLLRTYRHAGTDVLLTTQHLSGDIPAAALSCSPILTVFRCESPPVLEKLERAWGLDPSLVATLPQFEYLRISFGFDS